MQIDLQFFGGRGASGVNRGKGVIDRNAKERTIEAIYREARGRSGAYYKNTILKAVDSGNGELSFEYATPEKKEKTSSSNRTQYLTYKLKSGANDGEVFGVNWNNVKSVSGQTYDLRSELKERGFRWNGKKWVKQ